MESWMKLKCRLDCAQFRAYGGCKHTMGVEPDTNADKISKCAEEILEVIADVYGGSGIHSAEPIADIIRKHFGGL